MYYLIWQFSVLPLKKKGISNVQLIAKFWFYIYPCSNFERWTHGIQMRLFHLRKWAKTTKRLVLHDWLIGTSDSLLTGFILSEFMPLYFFLLFFLFAFFVCYESGYFKSNGRKYSKKKLEESAFPLSIEVYEKNVHLHTPVESRDRSLWS